MRPGGKQKEISEELPEARQLFARALSRLYDSTAGQDGKRLSYARLLRAMEAGRIATSCLSRYLSGENVPPENFVVRFHKTIDELTSTPPPVTCEELVHLRARAEATDGRRREARQRRFQEELEQRILARTADKPEPDALPVPHDAGDRQGNEFAEQPTPQAATEAIQLATQGRYAQTVTLLSRLSEHLDTNEVALCIVHFRLQHHDDLADTLIQIYGRDHRAGQQEQAILLSITLRKHGLGEDADALLRTLI